MIDVLAIGLSSWIIQDGNYGDFKCGDRAAFALEFYPATPLTEIAPAARSCVRTESGSYEVSAEIVHVAANWWVLDVGILLFWERIPPPNTRRGGWIRGAVEIAIDPFFYYERLAGTAGAPAMIYDWTIEKIEIQTAPLIETAPRFRERDRTQLGWKEIAKTDAWKDDGGNAEYVLHCRRHDTAARRAR